MARTTIAGTFTRGDDTPEHGYLTFALATSAYQTTLGKIFTTTPLKVNLDITGSFSIQLEPTSGADAAWIVDGMSYEVQEHFSGQVHRTYYIDVPTSGSTVDFGELSTFGTAPAVTGGVDIAGTYAPLVTPSLTGQVLVTAPAGGTVNGFTVRRDNGDSTYTTDLQHLAVGDVKVGSGAVSGTGALRVGQASTTRKGLVIQLSTSGASGNPLETRDDSGTIKARIDSAGNFIGTNIGGTLVACYVMAHGGTVPGTIPSGTVILERAT